MNTSRLRQILIAFATGQGASQIIQVISGFLLVRSLDVHDYGVIAFVVAVQSSASVLAEVGMRNGVIALLGSNISDRAALGRLITAALYQRQLNLWPVAIGIAVAFWIFHARQGLPLPLTLMLAGATILNVYFVSWTQYFALPWILSHDMGAYYKPQIIFQGARLGLFALLVAVHALDVLTVTAATLGATLGMALWYRRSMWALMGSPAAYEPKDLSHLRKYIFPLLPLEIFYAFQDQVTIFILTVAGQTTNLAQVFALGRLSLVFQFFVSATVVLATPLIARSSRDQLARRYAGVVLAAFLLSVLIVAGAIVFPSVYLWILGDHYRGLHSELILAIAGAALFFMFSVLHLLNNARQWFLMWSGYLYISIFVAIQAYFILHFDMSQTWNVLLMTLIANIGILAVPITNAVVGFSRK